MNHYELLGISQSATTQEVKDAYRKAALRYHPDRNGGSDAQFKAVATAYETLVDDVKRASYNRTIPKPKPPEKPKIKGKIPKFAKYEDRLAWIAANDPNINADLWKRPTYAKPKPPRPQPVKKTDANGFYDAFSRQYTDDYVPPIR